MNRVYHIPHLAQDVMEEVDRLNAKACTERYIREIMRVLDNLTGHYEMELDKDDNIVYSDVPCFYAETFNDDIANLFWGLGCSLTCYYDWYGNEEYTISLPETEEEYKSNLEEARKAYLADDM